MPQKTNIKAAPYFDDYDSSKDFYKVLFRPSYPVQGRELNTLQSILQNQVESYGKYRFKQGDLVVPGEVGLNKRLDFVKLSSVSEVAVNVDGEIIYQKYDIDGLINQKVSGLSSGVTALILAVSKQTENNNDTLYVKYLTAGTSGDEETFRQGETLEVVDGVNSPLLVVGTDGSVLPTNVAVTNPDTGAVTFVESGALGYAAAVKVEEGVYFVNGFFVRNDESLIVVDGYNNTPSVKVGFKVSESLVTPEEDSTLYDNSFGSSNYSAPGAHRLKIDLEVIKYDYDATPDKNFIQLLTIKNGVIQRQIKQADYSLLETTLAGRTYDESGDYVVDKFDIDVREFYQKDGNNGIYSLGLDGNVNGISSADASEKLVAAVGPGKAYVRGYEIVNKETKYLHIDKARDTLSRDNVTIKSSGLANFTISNVYNTLPLNAEGADLTAYPTIYLNGVYNDGTVGSNNTEADSDFLQTIERRGQGFNKDYGVKTIYLTCSVLSTIVDSSILPNTPTVYTDLKKIWIVTSRAVGGGAGTVASLDTLSFAKVDRPEIGNSTYLQLTVYGRKDYLDDLLVEYDDNVSSKRRNLYITESDANQETNEIGYINDYDETVIPLIGLAKPKDFSLVKRPEGFNVDTDIVISKGRTAGGATPYSGLFSVSYFNPVFFTRILVDSAISTDFSPGKYISGSTSGAYGVIEGDANGYLSSGKSLVVRTLYGNFLPGETIASEEGGLLRIARENTISHFVITAGGAGYTATGKVILNGIAYEPTDIETGVYSTGLYKIDIKNRDAVSTEYSVPPAVIIGDHDPSSTVATIVPVLFRDTVKTFSSQNVKSLYSSFGSGSKFSADIETIDSEYSEIKAVTEFTFSGTKGYKYLECNGFGIGASTYVSQGDIVQFNDSTGRLNKFVVAKTTKPEGTNKARIYLNGALPDTVTAESVVRLRPGLRSSSSSLIYPTGSKEISSLIKNSEDTKIKYYIRRDFVTIGADTGGNITFVAQLGFGTQRFADYNESDFLITVLDKGNSTKVETGDVIYISPDFVETKNVEDATSGLSSGSITLTFPAKYFGDNVTNFPKLKLTATLEVSKARPKVKSSNANKRIIITAAGDKVVPLRGIDYDSDSTDSYSYSDVYKIRYVYEGSSSAPPTVDVNGNLVVGTDITHRFTFDDGQRDTFYDVSRLVLKPGFAAPVGQVVVAFDYFEHSQGDFCTVDSYLHEDGVIADDVPNFNSSVHGIVNLRNVLDFRPKVDFNSIITGFQDTSLLSQSEYINFTGAGGSVSSTPASSDLLPYTVSFSEKQYLDRIDGVFLNQKGEFIVKSGNASLNPSKPEIIEDGIALYYMYVPAFTRTSKDIRILPVDNKRYTMRDIGKLEKRIERLEYYTTLSILEQQALNMQVKDALGIDRIKSGFIVDNFESHNIGNLNSIDYMCSIDSQQSVLRPQVKEDSFNLEELYTRDYERNIAGYVNNNKVITLPYTNIPYATNAYATKTINPNPFVVIQYVGDASIDPNIDQWYDTTVAPLVTDNNTGLFSIFLAKDAKESFSSIYNSFVINWVGVSKTFFNINSLSENNSSSSETSVNIASVSSSSNISPQNNEIAKGVGYKTVNNTTVADTLRFFARSIPIKFVLKRLKPKTQINVFMEGRNIGRWVNPDSRFTGVAGNSLSPFNTSLVSDEYGNASGIILVPAGNPPKESSVWTDDINTLQYDTTSEEIRFSTGSKTIRFTSSATDVDKNTVDTYAEVKFYATGVLPENPSSIISTTPAFFKANEGVQLIDVNTENTARPNPLAQTFKVENFEGGMFATGVDLFFSKKSSSIPLRVYLSNLQSEKPGKYVVPGSEVTLYPDTFLKIYSSGNITLKVGEYVTGNRSLASGPLSKIFDRNNFEVLPNSVGEISITNEQVYTFVLNNHNGTSFQANEDITLSSVTQYNNANNATIGLKIAKDSGRVTGLNVTNLGSGYEGATITIESPQLTGGANATGSAKVSNGQLYLAEVSVAGRGYTEAPAIVVRGSGASATGAVIESEITIDEPAVRMGIAIDTDTTINSTIPTRFNFSYPVYLQDNTEYALNIECDTTEYEIWASRLGETDISSGLVVNTQPLLGSVFKSQNVDNWTEDLFEDIKFTLYRAEFDISRSAELFLTNSDLGYEKLDKDPFESYALSNSTASSTLFKNNANVVKVNHRDHGFETGGKSKVYFRGLESFAGFDDSDLENSLYTTSNSGIDSYTIFGPTRASSTGFGGGSTVLASHNRKYERLYAQVPYLQTSSTKIESYVTTTNIVPVDSNTTNYTSYSLSDTETTFLNEEQYFLNQKVIASKINETINSIDNSLLYKINLSSESSHLSPLIDLRSASVKIATNRVENATGSEDRYGKKYQVVQLYPVYKFTVSGNGASPVLLNQNVEGYNTGATSEVLRVVNNDVYVKVKNSLQFEVGEPLIFSTQSTTDYSALVTNGVATSITHNGTVDSNRTSGQYLAVAGTDPRDSSGNVANGTGASFNVTVANDGNVEVTLVSGGQDWTATDTCKIADSLLGGGGGADILVTINSVANVPQVKVSTDGIFEIVPNFVTSSTVTAYNPSSLSEKYDAKISGKVIVWDSKTKTLTLENDKTPINGNYISTITVGSDYARSTATNDQKDDIFRVGDLVDWEGSAVETAKFAEVKSMSFDTGVDYVPEDGSLNTSGVSKYVTKEIFIDSPATAVNVYMTLNVSDIDDVKVLYKTKLTASQENFNDINWRYFNVDGSPDQKDVLATTGNSISGQYEKQSSYQELRYTVSDLADFSSFAVKIVMRTSDPSYVPKVQDIRAVASY